jgi:hypothetical protein
VLCTDEVDAVGNVLKSWGAGAGVEVDGESTARRVTSFR